MSFKLELTVTGMCLYVPDADTGNLHVVLVRHDGHHTDGQDRHFTRLVYDKAHATGEAEPLKEYACENLTGKALSLFEGARDVDLELSDPKTGESPIVDLREIAPGGTLKREWVLGEPLDDGTRPLPEMVAARITLGRGRITNVTPGDLWWVARERKQRLTAAITWTIDDVTTQDLKNWTSTELMPIEDVIRLNVYNATLDGLPPAEDKYPQDRQEGRPAKHFEGYYDLYKRVPVVIPVRAEPGKRPDTDQIQRSDCKAASAMLSLGASNCVHAKSTILTPT